jgi:hypothetical protein
MAVKKNDDKVKVDSISYKATVPFSVVQDVEIGFFSSFNGEETVDMDVTLTSGGIVVFNHEHDRGKVKEILKKHGIDPGTVKQIKFKAHYKGINGDYDKVNIYTIDPKKLYIDEDLSWITVITDLNKVKMGSIVVPVYDNKNKKLSFAFFDPTDGSKPPVVIDYLKDLKTKPKVEFSYRNRTLRAVVVADKKLYTILNDKVYKVPTDKEGKFFLMLDKNASYFLYKDQKNVKLINYKGRTISNVPVPPDAVAGAKLFDSVAVLSDNNVSYSEGSCVLVDIGTKSPKVEKLPTKKNGVFDLDTDKLAVIFNRKDGSIEFRVYNKNNPHFLKYIIDKATVKKYNLSSDNIYITKRNDFVLLRGKKSMLIFTLHPDKLNLEGVFNIANKQDENVFVDYDNLYIDYDTAVIPADVYNVRSRPRDKVAIYVFKKKKGNYNLVGKMPVSESFQSCILVGHNDKYVFYRIDKNVIGVDKSGKKFITVAENLPLSKDYYYHVTENIGKGQNRVIDYNQKRSSLYYLDMEDKSIHRNIIHLHEPSYMNNEMIVGTFVEHPQNVIGSSSIAQPKKTVCFVKYGDKPRVMYRVDGKRAIPISNLNIEGRKLCLFLIDHSDAHYTKDKATLHWLITTPEGKRVAENAVSLVNKRGKPYIYSPWTVASSIREQIRSLFKDFEADIQKAQAKSRDQDKELEREMG